jgi:hypothetical protein
MKNMLISGFAGLCLGVALVYFLTPPPDPVIPEIVEVVKYETKWIKPPVTACEKSPIVISHHQEGQWLHIDAGDGCKSTAESIRQACPDQKFNVKSHAVSFGAGALAALVFVIFL